MYLQGIEELEKSLALKENMSIRAELGYAYGLADKRQDAERILSDFLRLQNEGNEDFGFEIAVTYIGLGEKEKALE